MYKIVIATLMNKIANLYKKRQRLTTDTSKSHADTVFTRINQKISSSRTNSISIQADTLNLQVKQIYSLLLRCWN
jgi:hypothetical protein